MDTYVIPFPKSVHQLTDLPFVADIGRGRQMRRCYWSTPPADDYATANTIGLQYAADFVQYLKENPRNVGSNILGHIVADMAGLDFGIDPAKGYAVGFFVFLESLLYTAATSTDHYAKAQREARHYAALLAAREGAAK